MAKSLDQKFLGYAKEMEKGWGKFWKAAVTKYCRFNSDPKQSSDFCILWKLYWWINGKLRWMHGVVIVATRK